MNTPQHCSRKQKQGAGPAGFPLSGAGVAHQNGGLIAHLEAAALRKMLARLETRLVGRDEREAHRLVDCALYLREHLGEVAA